MIGIFLIVSIGLVTARISVEPEYLDQLRAEGRDEEYAKLLGLDVKLVRPRDGGRSEGSMMNQVSRLGDILMTPEQDEEARQGINFTRYRGNKWQNGRIPYTIAAGDFSDSQLRTIRSALADCNSKFKNLQIVPRNNEKDYVHIMSGDGCWSYVGKVGDAQGMSLQRNGCVSRGTVQHEFMHAAGFTHEQNRPDRDDYVTLKPENIPDKWKSQYEKVSARDYAIQGPYDYYSVMHYPVNAPETNRPAFSVRRSNVDESRIGNGNEMTSGDVDKMNVLYN